MTSFSAGRRGSAICYWQRNGETARNFGDALNPLLIARMTGAEVRHYDDCWPWRKALRPVLFAAGSILERDKRSMRHLRAAIHVWGTGTRGTNSLRHLAGARIHAVRGPLTRRRLLEDGIDCPEAYGDPATLLPLYFPRPEMREDVVSVIPHYVDQEPCRAWMASSEFGERVRVIDVMSDCEEVITQIARSRCVLSSSLHGLIVADAYRVPNVRIRFSDRISGGDFKFDDYFLSVRREPRPPIDMMLAQAAQLALAGCCLGEIDAIRGIGDRFPSAVLR